MENQAELGKIKKKESAVKETLSSQLKYFDSIKKNLCSARQRSFSREQLNKEGKPERQQLQLRI